MKNYKNNIVNYSLVKETTEYPLVKIKNAESVYDFIKPIYGSSIDVQESIYLITMNNNNEINGYVEVSKGTINSATLDIRIIMKYAISSLSTSIILCHNHPSGKLKPSTSDKKLTNKVEKALKSIDIDLLDHLIVTSKSYYSFANENLL